MIKRLPPLDPRIPAWNFDDLEPRHCPLCASTGANVAFVRPDGLTIQHCSQCGTFFVSPSPSDKQLTLFYSSYDEQHRRGGPVSVSEIAKAYKHIDPLANLRIRELASLMPLAGTNVLDVGFGHAYLLYAFRQLGAVPWGCELDINSVHAARALGIDNVFHGGIESVPDTARFDVIVMNDVIEHPLRPHELLDHAKRLLRSGGYLVIWTPNGELGHREPQPSVFRMDLEHMQYLTPRSCNFIAENYDMPIVHLETVGFPSDMRTISSAGSTTSSARLSQSTLKRYVKALPFYHRVNKVRLAYSTWRSPEARAGAYNLFCIFEKGTEKSLAQRPAPKQDGTGLQAANR